MMREQSGSAILLLPPAGSGRDAGERRLPAAAAGALRGRRRSLFRLAAVTALAATAAACTLNPVTRRPNLVLVSRAGEKELGDTKERDVEELIGPADHAALAACVAAVGERLAAHSPRRDVTFRFRVLDTQDVNAFALPNGTIYVSRGLLALLNSEDELAGVLAHEVAHVAARHTTQQITAARALAGVQLLTFIAGTAVYPGLGDLAAGLTGIAGAGGIAAYSRSNELEADRIGQELAMRAGWDPAAPVGFLQTLERARKAFDMPGLAGGFLASHPASETRMRELARRGSTPGRADAAPMRAARAAFVAQLDGLVVGPSAAWGVLDGSTFLHPVGDFALEVPPDWKIRIARPGLLASEPGCCGHVVIASVGTGSDPGIGPAELKGGGGMNTDLPPTRTTINSLPALRMRFRSSLQRMSATGRHEVSDFTWVAHRDRVWQLKGATLAPGTDEDLALFERVAQSFRPLTDAERERVTELRLRIVAALDGETLEALAARTGSEWTADQIAAANGLAPDAVPGAGSPVKIARREPFLPGATRP